MRCERSGDEEGERTRGGSGWRGEGVDSEGSEGPLDGAGEVSDGLER